MISHNVATIIEQANLKSCGIIVICLMVKPVHGRNGDQTKEKSEHVETKGDALVHISRNQNSLHLTLVFCLSLCMTQYYSNVIESNPNGVSTGTCPIIRWDSNNYMAKISTVRRFHKGTRGRPFVMCSVSTPVLFEQMTQKELGDQYTIYLKKCEALRWQK
jgi:hypothetical protein